MKKKNKQSKGFTLLELLIVVAIIGLLITIAIPAFQGMLRRARIATMKASLEGLETIILDKGLIPVPGGTDFCHGVGEPLPNPATYPEIEDIYITLEDIAGNAICRSTIDGVETCIQVNNVVQEDGTRVSLCGDWQGNIYLGGTCQVPLGADPGAIPTECRI